MRRLFFAALLAAGCTTSKGDSLVKVTVDAVPPLSNVALLHTVSMAGGETVLRDVGADQAPFSLGGGEKHDFAVQVRNAIMGSFMIHVEAHDADGKVLGKGDGMTTLAPGKVQAIEIVLGPDTMPPLILSQPVWIGSGGSAASGAQQLNLNFGGFDTVGASNAASGAQLGSFFSSQTN